MKRAVREASPYGPTPRDELFLKKQEAHHSSFAEQDVLPCLSIGVRERETRPLHFGSKPGCFPAYFRLSSTATATLTVAPTMGLLPMPRKPIISTWAGTEEEPANWASLCIRPMVSVMP